MGVVVEGGCLRADLGVEERLELRHRFRAERTDLADLRNDLRRAQRRQRCNVAQRVATQRTML
jgi:hypothetical protein